MSSPTKSAVITVVPAPTIVTAPVVSSTVATVGLLEEYLIVSPSILGVRVAVGAVNSSPKYALIVLPS